VTLRSGVTPFFVHLADVFITDRVPMGMARLDLAWIMHDVEKFSGDSGEKQPIHVATRCSNEFPRVSTLRHSDHDRQYAASV
jgi:hypothetical protein